VLERPQKQTTAIATATRVEQATSTILFGLLMMHNQSVDRDNRGFKTGFRMPQKGGGVVWRREAGVCACLPHSECTQICIDSSITFASHLSKWGKSIEGFPSGRRKSKGKGSKIPTRRPHTMPLAIVFTS